RGWAPGDTELELADLGLSLLVRLVPSLPAMQPLVAEGLKAMAFKLAFQFCCLEERSSSPIVQALRSARREAAVARFAAPTTSSSGNSGAMVLAAAAPPLPTSSKAAGSRSAACNRGARVMSVRCSLARLLRDMAAAAVGAPQAAAAGTAASSPPGGLLRAVGPPDHRELDPLTGRPTLLLVRDMGQQACFDAAAALDELTELLALLRMPDAQLDEQTVTERLRAYAPAGSATVAAAVAAGSAAGGLAARRRLARHFWALAATSLDRQLARALFVLEAALSTIAIHFLRCLPRPLSSVSSMLSANGRDVPASRGLTSSSMDTDELLDQATANLDLAAALPTPTEADTRALGSEDELRYFLSQLQETCRQAEEPLARRPCWAVWERLQAWVWVWVVWVRQGTGLLRTRWVPRSRCSSSRWRGLI
ncbi:hypothetical protein Agub_g14663, partial [Astrephomene gubernaculifera]